MQPPEMTLPISADDEAYRRMQRAYVDVAAEIRKQASSGNPLVNAAYIGSDIYCTSDLTDELLIFPVHDLDKGVLRDLHLPQHIAGLSQCDVVEYTQLARQWLKSATTLCMPQQLIDEQYEQMIAECRSNRDAA